MIIKTKISSHWCINTKLSFIFHPFSYHFLHLYLPFHCYFPLHATKILFYHHSWVPLHSHIAFDTPAIGWVLRRTVWNIYELKQSYDWIMSNNWIYYCHDLLPAPIEMVYVLIRINRLNQFSFKLNNKWIFSYACDWSSTYDATRIAWSIGVHWMFW